MADTIITKAEAFLESHNVRSVFEKWAFVSFISIILVFCFLAVIGILWPPLAKGPDWGKSIVDRIVELKDAIFDLLSALGGGVGISLARGHFDLKARGDGDGDSH